MGDQFDVIMLAGMPGVGKSHFAKKDCSNYPLVELDGIREEMGVDPGEEEGHVQQRTKERCRELLRAKTPFVFAAVNHLKKTRRRWIGLFKGYHANVTIIYMEKPFDIMMKQNKNREKVVPEGIVREMFSRLEVPNWDECNMLMFKTTDGKEIK